MNTTLSQIAARQQNFSVFPAMTHELILTSVSQGLEQGSRGFCTVGEDAAIPTFLQKRLESLSDYQHLFAPHDDEYPLQPVAYSHVIFPGPDSSVWHSLSRIADIGVDFQSQPNRLAHHIALQEDEWIPEGPAWLLALPGFHLPQWLTPSVRFAQGRPIPSLTAPPPLTRRQWIARQRRWLDPGKMNPLSYTQTIEADELQTFNVANEEQIAMIALPSSPCPTWRKMTGDVLADTINTGQEVAILFRPGQNLLPLFVEALSLLPASSTWLGTFCTWYNHLPEHVICQWKGVLADTPLADQVQQNKNTLLIDLTQPMQAVPAGDGKLALYNKPCPEPQYGEDREVQYKLHRRERHDYDVRPADHHIAQVFAAAREFLRFEILAHERLHDANVYQVLAHHSVQGVDLPLYLKKERETPPHN